jgi:hypothetical protein
MTKTARFLAVMLTALVLSVALSHSWEAPAKLSLTWPEYFAVQENYGRYGLVAVSLEVAAMITTAASAVLLRKHRQTLALTLGALILLCAGFAVWLLLAAPANLAWNGASPTLPPPDWTALRTQWEYAYAVRAFFQLVALGLLTLSLVLETSNGIRTRVYP